MRIRSETEADRDTVHALVAESFGRPDEAVLVDALRRDGDLVLSLVAEDQGVLAGHVALSRLRSPVRALALAPVAIAPSMQRRGIGSALIRHALAQAHTLDSEIVFVLGEPDYYARFGFSAAAAAPYPCAYAGPYFMALLLGEREMPLAQVVYPDAFAALS